MKAFMSGGHTVYLFRERVSPAVSILMDMYTWFFTWELRS